VKKKGNGFSRLTKKQEKGSCHCGLDPQSLKNQLFFLVRLRVKPAMADFLVSPEALLRLVRNSINFPAS